MNREDLDLVFNLLDEIRNRRPLNVDEKNLLDRINTIIEFDKIQSKFNEDTKAFNEKMKALSDKEKVGE